MDEFQQHWLNTYKESSKETETYLMSTWHKEGFYERLRVFEKLLIKHKNDSIKSVFDIGCGPGNYFEVYKKFGLQITGIDFSAEQLEHAKKRYPEITYFNGTVEDFVSEKPFDLAVTIGVTQNVSNIGSFIGGIASHLRENGIAIISFLNQNSLLPKFMTSKYLKMFSFQEMKHICEPHFQLIEFKRFYPMPAMLSFMQKPLYALQIPLLNHGYMFVLRKKN
jgi:2-polyprenyl-3-methyl-5-hydroxy-6-metoxy-1,4-benzoquinol methylase